MTISSQIEAVKLLAVAYQNACHSSSPNAAFAMRITHSALTQAKRELLSK